MTAPIEFPKDLMDALPHGADIPFDDAYRCGVTRAFVAKAIFIIQRISARRASSPTDWEAEERDILALVQLFSVSCAGAWIRETLTRIVTAISAHSLAGLGFGGVIVNLKDWEARL